MVILENITGTNPLKNNTTPGTNKIYLVKTPNEYGFAISSILDDSTDDSWSDINNTVSSVTFSISLSINNKIKVTKLSGIIKICSSNNNGANNGYYDIENVSDVSIGDFVRYSYNILTDRNKVYRNYLYEIEDINPKENTIKLKGTGDDNYDTSGIGLDNQSYFIIYKKEHVFKFSDIDDNLFVNKGNFKILDTSNVNKDDYVRSSQGIRRDTTYINNKFLYKIYDKTNASIRLKKLDANEHIEYNTNKPRIELTPTFTTATNLTQPESDNIKSIIRNNLYFNSPYDITWDGTKYKLKLTEENNTLLTDLEGKANDKNTIIITAIREKIPTINQLDIEKIDGGLNDPGYFTIHKKGINVTIQNDEQLNSEKHCIIDNSILKITLTAEEKEKINKSSNNKIIINSISNLKNKEVKLYKTVNNFAEFDPAIFDP